MGVDKVESKKKVLIAVPVDSVVTAASYQNHIEYMFRLGKKAVDLPYDFSIGVIEGCFTPVARERICETAVNAGMDFVFMFDDDMMLPMDCAERLLKHDLDIVAALAFMKRPPYHPVIFSQRRGFENGKMYFSTDTIQNYPKNSLFECDASGFGAIVIKVDLLKRMPKPWFQSTCGTGEDLLFCFNAKQHAGASTFVDTSVKVGHLAPRTRVIDEAEYERVSSANRLREVCGDYSEKKKESNLVA